MLSGDNIYNATWIDTCLGSDTKSSETWKFEVKSGSELWVGVGTENGFATGYGLKAMLFGGPGNLSSGGGLVQSKLHYKIKNVCTDCKIF